MPNEKTSDEPTISTNNSEKNTATPAGDTKLLSLAEQTKLINAFATLKDTMSMLLMRHNGVIILKPESIRKFRQECNKRQGRAPHVDIRPCDDKGSWKAELQWNPPTPKPEVDIEQFRTIIQNIGVEMSDHEIADLSRREAEEILTYNQAHQAAAAGVTVAFPPWPSALPNPVEQPTKQVAECSPEVQAKYTKLSEQTIDQAMEEICDIVSNPGDTSRITTSHDHTDKPS